MSSTWSALGQYAIDLEQSLNYSAEGLFGYDKVALGPAAKSSSLSLDHQVVSGIAEWTYDLGFIPLGIPEQSFSSLSQSIDPLMLQLRNQSKIPSVSFAYTAGAKYRSKGVFGSLILGGYDSTRFKGNNNPFSFTLSTDPSRLLTVGVESITAQNTLQGTFGLSSGSHFSLIDSTVSHLWLPRAICDNFEKAFGLIYDPQADLYLVNNTIHDKLTSLNPSITIKLVASLTDTSTNYTNIILPYSAFDLQASYPHYQNATNYFPIRRAANESQYTLGRTLLQEAYLTVDYERGNFSVNQAIFPDPLPAAKIVTILPPSNSTTTPNSTPSSKSGLGTGAIAGIAAGGAILLIIVLVGAFLLYRKRYPSKRKKYELANTQIAEAGTPLTSNPHKSPNIPSHPQELGGTPLTELASPREGYAYGHEQKGYLSPGVEPQELPITPAGWGAAGGRARGRARTQYYEMDGESSANVSRAQSREPSEDRHGTHNSRATAGISPLTPGGGTARGHYR